MTGSYLNYRRRNTTIGRAAFLILGGLAGWPSLRREPASGKVGLDSGRRWNAEKVNQPIFGNAGESGERHCNLAAEPLELGRREGKSAGAGRYGHILAAGATP